jgi:hypothetical protein
MRIPHVWLGLLLMVSACAPETLDEDEPLGDLGPDGKADGSGDTVDHGALLFDVSAAGALSPEAARHVWAFELDGRASIELRTFARDPDDDPDTVLYLYKRRQSGWKLLEKNDNGAYDKHWSWLERDLTSGSYRVLVKGKQREAEGDFFVEASCVGDGCPEKTCVFGSPGADLSGLASSYVSASEPAVELAADDTAPDSPSARRLIAAMALIQGDAPPSVEAAFGVIGGAAEERRYLDVGGTSYLVLGFTIASEQVGSGRHTLVYRDLPDDDGSAEALAHFAEADAFCAAPPPSCAFGIHEVDLRSDPAFKTTTRSLATTRSFDELIRAQVLAAAQGVATIRSADEIFRHTEVIELLTLHDRRSGVDYQAVLMFSSSGDTYGAIFFAGTDSRAAVVTDGWIGRCSAFTPVP